MHTHTHTYLHTHRRTKSNTIPYLILCVLRDPGQSVGEEAGVERVQHGARAGDGVVGLVFLLFICL